MHAYTQNRSPLTNVTISDELTLLTDEDYTGPPGDENVTPPPAAANATPPSDAAADRVGSHLTSGVHTPLSSASVGQIKGAFEFEVWRKGRVWNGETHGQARKSKRARLACVYQRVRVCTGACASGSRINHACVIHDLIARPGALHAIAEKLNTPTLPAPPVERRFP